MGSVRPIRQAAMVAIGSPIRGRPWWCLSQNRMSVLRSSAFRRTVGRTKRGCQVKCFGRLIHPGTLPVGGAARAACSQGVDFRSGHWCVDAAKPVLRTWQWPVAQRQGTTIARVQACPDATPDPVFGSTNQPSTHGVTFHVPANCIEMVITWHLPAIKFRARTVCASDIGD